MFQYVRIRLRTMVRDDRGASAVEYGLLVALIAIAIIVAITFLGDSLDAIFNKTATAVNTAAQ